MTDRLTQADAITILSALGNEERLRIFQIIRKAGRGGVRAGQISDAMDVSHSTTSTRLSELMGAGLIQRRAQGRLRIYTADMAPVFALATFFGGRG